MVKVKNGTLAIKKLSPLSFNQIYQTPLFDTKQFTTDFCQSLDQMVIEINKNYK